MACAILCLGVLATSAQASESFSFDDIHYWIGEGTNRAGIVIDWNNGRPRSSLAWGVRWNGVSTNLTTWLKRLAHEDRRLYAVVNTTVDGLAYDADGDGGFFDLNAGEASDDDDFVGVETIVSGWFLTSIRAPVLVDNSMWVKNLGEVEGKCLESEEWVGFKHTMHLEAEKSPAIPTYAETPYAFEVVDHFTDPEFTLYEEYRSIHAETVLGRPSTHCPGWEYDGVVFPDTPITPHSQAFGTNQVLTLASLSDDEDQLDRLGFVTVKFDHRILDDLQNPYGIDFIVFGNAFLYMGENQYFDGSGDPNEYTDAMAEFDVKPGLVEVSQDGTNWVSYSEGPYANTFAPTISHLYDTNSPDASLFAGNRWWGESADPTLPLDPTLTPNDFLRRTVAEYATLFNGSSGGTGFDIGLFDLPVDEKTGRKWIQYIRVTTLGTEEDGLWTVIDGFADVSPALPYDNWAREHYAWTDLPNQAVSGKQALAVNGKPNFYNAAFGTTPDDPPVEGFAISGFAIEDGRAVFRLPFAGAYDAFRVGKASVVDGKYRDHLPTFEGTIETERGIESVFSIPVEAEAEKGFYKISISAQ